MSLDHEPLGDMGARGPAPEACPFAKAGQGDRGRPVVPWTFDVRVLSPRDDKFSMVNSAVEPISSPA
jgi:hypothetical protein